MMRGPLSTATATAKRMASWIRKDEPKTAPEHGHCYLIALYGSDRVAH